MWKKEAPGALRSRSSQSGCAVGSMISTVIEFVGFVELVELVGFVG